jgi:hypothetical protein
MACTRRCKVARSGTSRERQPRSKTLGMVLLGALLGHRHMPPAGQGLDHGKQVGGAMPVVLVVPPLDVPRDRRQARAHLPTEYDRFLAEACERY